MISQIISALQLKVCARARVAICTHAHTLYVFMHFPQAFALIEIVFTFTVRMQAMKLPVASRQSPKYNPHRALLIAINLGIVALEGFTHCCYRSIEKI